LDDALIFEPTNVEEFIKTLENYEPIIISREEFIEKFKRDIIFDEMTESILELIPTRKLQLI
jgi:hypothetical protein